MPLFDFASGVQISNSNFYDIAGDMNVQGAPVTTVERELEMLLQPASFPGVSGLLGAERSQHIKAARMSPYDISRRPNHLRDSYHNYHQSSPALLAAFSGNIYPSSALELKDQHSFAQSDPSHSQSVAGGSGYGEGFWPNPEPPHSLARIDQGSRPTSPGSHPSSYPTLLDRGQPDTQMTINGGTFINGNVNYPSRFRGEEGWHILYRAAANDASHNSAERYPHPRCHPETRTEMLEELSRWSVDDDPESRVLWLYGPAGAGKSAIAQSFCQKLEAEDRLGSSLFFKRGHPSRGNSRRLFVTIAYQLALQVPKVKRIVSQLVEDDPSIVDKDLSLQLQKLIIEPFRDLKSCLDYTFIIIIDGLDECESEDIQKALLRYIGAAGVTSLPLRFLVASRPEPHIREAFHEPCLYICHRPLNIRQSFDDVRTYLKDEFTRIYQEHGQALRTTATPWPSPTVIERLVEKSSGYFIYGSTVIKFIDDKNFRPTDQLGIVMGMIEPDAESASPFEALDQLYTQILTSAPGRSRLSQILTVIAANLIGISSFVDRIEQLLDLRPGDVLLALRGLHSVINIEEDYSPAPARVRAHHASFFDFLGNPTRSGMFYVGGAHRIDLAKIIVKKLSTLNLMDRTAWELASDWTGVKYVAGTHVPSRDLLQLLDAINPVFLFHTPFELDKKGRTCAQGSAEVMLKWLTKIRPVPQDLIQLWEYYYFLSLFTPMATRAVPLSETSDYGMTLQACPQLCRYLHAFRIVSSWPYTQTRQFFDIRLLLDWSWDEVMAAFSPLREILGSEEAEVAALLKWTIKAGPPPFRSLCSRFTLRELALNCLNILKRLITKELPKQFAGCISTWSHLLSSCAPSSDLLSALELVSPESYLVDHYRGEELLNIVEWLKTFPRPPPGLTARYDYTLDMQTWGERLISSDGRWREEQQKATLPIRCDCFGFQ
ncbi:hypothetical protein C8R43DRAFT_1016809 [Mycena crocata]|nr:hypothetical protein C8R43DRAFT_1016809 [Mycena crocata]